MDQRTTSKRSFNAQWTITLFGTAVGAGILFLPISAGSFGFIPLLIATLLIGPMTYFSHHAFSWIMNHSPIPGADVLMVLTKFFGRNKGILLAAMYWFTVFPVVLIYGVSITNTVESLIVNQFHGPEISRWILAPLCVGLMTAALAFGNKVMLAAANLVVYPLIFALGAVSLYLIPQWDFASFMQAGDHSALGILTSILLILPVLVFAFSYVAALSQFCVAAHKDGRPTANAIRNSTILLTVFTMFFVWSSALAMGADGMIEAEAQNLPVLSYFANVTDNPFLSYMAPVVVICAVASSYFGHALGTIEGTQYLAELAMPGLTRRLSPRAFDLWTYFFIFVTVSLAAVFNPSILSLITLVGGIFFTFLTYLLPMLCVHCVPALEQYRGRATNVFVTVMGLIVLATTVVTMF